MRFWLRLLHGHGADATSSADLQLSGRQALHPEGGFVWPQNHRCRGRPGLGAANRPQLWKTGLHLRFSNLSAVRRYVHRLRLVIGYIANDRMLVVLDRFFHGEITDLVLINSLPDLKLGKQYVELAERACSQITVLDKHAISVEDRKMLKTESESNCLKGIVLTDEICRNSTHKNPKAASNELWPGLHRKEEFCAHIYLMGDTHGNFGQIYTCCQTRQTTRQYSEI